MKQFLRYLFVVAAMLMVVVGDAWAEWPTYSGTIQNVGGEYYVYYETNEKSYSAPGGNSWTTPVFAGPPASISFDAAKSGLWAVGDIEIDQLVDGTGWVDLTTVMPSGNYKKYQSFGSYGLNMRTTKVSFYSNGSYERYIKNIKVPMLSYMGKTGATSWTAPDAIIGASDATCELKLDWSNTSALTGSLSGDDASQFSFSITNNASAGKYGTATIVITYRYDKVSLASSHKAKLTLSNGEEIALSGITLSKKIDFTWKLENNYLVGDAGYLINGYELKDAKGNIITSDLHKYVTFSSSDDKVVAIDMEKGTITAVGEGTATITATFNGEEGWESFNETITLNIRKRTANFVWTLNEPSYHVDDYAELINIYTLKDNATGADVLSELHSLISFESDDSNIVSVKQNSEGKWVVFAENAGEAKVTASFGGNYKWNAFTYELPLSIIKYTPVFTWNKNGTPYYYGSSIPDIFSTTNTDAECTVSFTSDNEAFARVENNTLYIANLNETATITVEQKENYKWYGLKKDYLITPVNGNTHVRIEINDESEYYLF